MANFNKITWPSGHTGLSANKYTIVAVVVVSLKGGFVLLVGGNLVVSLEES